jgi:hypothetical protein
MARARTLAFVGAWLACACGGTSPPHTQRFTVYEWKPRILHSEEHQAGASECTNNADCGTHPHTKETLCYHFSFCMNICEDHWGDCNEDYRDGCEQSIDHRIYCAGDPRIGAYSPPTVATWADGPAEGHGHYNSLRMSRVLDHWLPGLQHCYEQVLATDPKLEATLSYKLTVGTSGRVVDAAFVQSDIESPALKVCMTRYLSALWFEPPPIGGPVTFPYRFLFIAGSYEGEEPNSE